MSTNKTDNFNLNVPAGTENYNIEDQNENMKIIDEELQKLTTQQNDITKETDWVKVTSLLNGWTGTIYYNLKGNILTVKLSMVSNGESKKGLICYYFPKELSGLVQNQGILYSSKSGILGQISFGVDTNNENKIYLSIEDLNGSPQVANTVISTTINVKLGGVNVG